MRFSRSLFYQLRDLAVLSNHSTTQLRYSDSSLELRYEYHAEHNVSIGFFYRWAPLVTLGFLVPQVWPLPSLWMNAVCLFLIVVAVLHLFRKSVCRLEQAGLTILTYSAGDERFQFEYPKGNALPLGEALLFKDIRAVRMRTATNGGEDDPVYGLVEIQRILEGPWILLAELPNQAAAQQFIALLFHLAGVNETVTETSTALWLGKAGRQLAHFYYKLTHVKTR